MTTLPRLSRPTLIRVAGVGLAGVGLVLAGCSSSPEPTIPPESQATATGETVTGVAATILQAGQKTMDAGTARFSVSGSTTGIDSSSATSDGSSTYTMEGGYNFTNNSFEAKMSAGALGQAGEVQIIVADGATYMKIPGFGDGKWLKAPLSEIGVDDSFSDPQEAFDDLKNLSDLTEVGPDTVDGVQATKYTGTQSIDDALEEAGVPDSENSSGNVSGESQTSIWIDGEGRLIQMMSKTTAKVGGKAVATETTMRFYDFGTDLSISAPPADEVTDFSDLANVPGLPSDVPGLPSEPQSDLAGQ